MRTAITFRPGSIGDCLMATYLLENLRAAYPELRPTIVVGTRGAMVQDLLLAYPWIEVLEVNRRHTRALAVFFVRHYPTDVVVTPYTGGQVGWYTKIVARLLAKQLMGYADTAKWSGVVYDRLIPLVGRSRAPRLLETDMLEALGVPVAFDQPRFVYVPQDGLLERVGVANKGYIILHLFSGGDARGLSLDRKRALIAALKEKITLPILLTGSPKEIETLGPLPQGVRGVVTSLQELAHLIDHAACMVSLDTGAAHLAAHLRKPLLVLASCLGVQWWGAAMYGGDVPSALCTRLDVCKEGHRYEGYAPCLDAIDAHEVAARTLALL